MPRFRADRLATVYLVHPVGRLIRDSGTDVPILMYHSISGVDEGYRHPYYRTATDVRVFLEHMRFLRDNRYEVITLSEAARLTRESAEDAKRRVVLTFDDGYQDFYTAAYPILSAFGYSATVFLPTGHIGEAAQAFGGTKCMTWNQIRRLHETGIEFGSHTVTHPQLRTLENKDIQHELRRSKQTIEERLGCPVKSFSYPYAFPETDRLFKQRLRETLEEVGYQNGVSTIIGTAGRQSDRFFMERLPVNSCDDLRFFRAKIEGAYDWLHLLQYTGKLGKLGRRVRRSRD